MLLVQWPTEPAAASVVAQTTVGTPLRVHLLRAAESRPRVKATGSDAAAIQKAEPRVDRKAGRTTTVMPPPDERSSITPRGAGPPQLSAQRSEAVVSPIRQPVVPGTTPAERTPETTNIAAASNRSAVIQTELMSLLHQAIDRHKRYPHSALRMGREGAARIDFRLAPDGRIEELNIGDSSGVRALDLAAFRAVQAIAPFPEAGRYLERSQLFQVDVVFRFN